jgi:methionyl aminopeptidase
MVLAIEPMFSLGSEDIIQKRDESYASADGSITAHVEHTIIITDSKPIIATKL